MQIILQEDEILEALDAYVRERIMLADNQTIAIDLKAGRGENGFTATLDIKTHKPAATQDLTESAKKSASVMVEVAKEVTIQSEPESEPEARTEPQIEDAASETATSDDEELAAKSAKSKSIFAAKPEVEEAPEADPAETPAPVGSIFNFGKTKAGA